MAVHTEKAAAMAKALAVWHATVPPCATGWGGFSRSCEGFSSTALHPPSLLPNATTGGEDVFGRRAELSAVPGGAAEAAVAQDSEADWWVDTELRKVIHY